MKSTLDLEQMLYTHLKPGALVAEITGKLYKGGRPVNSLGVEDVVIDSLATNNLQLQTAVINVNIHVPNLTVTHNGIQQRVKNSERLGELFRLAELELRDQIIGNTGFDIEQQLEFEEEESSYINIRLELYNINISN